MTTLFEQEKQEILTELKISKENSKHYEKIKDNFELSQFYEKWLFIGRILKIRK